MSTFPFYFGTGQSCPWTGIRNKFLPEFAYFFGAGMVGINFSFTGTGAGIPKSQINFVHESFFAVNRSVFK